MRKSRRYRRTGLLKDEDEQSPMANIANVFDVAMVFSVALLVALVMSYHLPELLSSSEDFTIVKNPGAEDMKIIVKEEGKPIEVLNMTDSIGGGTGEALGTAYKLADGRVIYVPEDSEGNSTSTSANTSSSSKSAST
ncbi:hypothetical protein SAMN02910340_01043 [Methanosarcina thermophila]|jgi:hypothetical protein|uniref:DUF2149 domain-containing protein n=2 Tax=Methanosarcina thermophila TaxID=2210 RepID=A0A1I6YPG2_METTE|nr:DUF2149 domain-containing protein [Methanosarcina thermophila]ALK05162.1 MAG: hypothetical protein AAY43_04915 [Methanosarcina sp. 795]AKB15435.1 hypothetical protein MSTHC_1117 [Methanosarcina thermophila CHTI-55]NLU58234.1 DUF2149 domain-containing protein [Methanosarcina thermophila]SFT52359.1 hypothetical protein SAMN02910340_01043 [Methanosarcina thermophila]BAW28962.1 conserved hypothetical protein [Methanosarcina thermophila]